MPRRPSSQLSFADREEISRGLAAGASVRTIGTVIGRPGSPVSREIARHGGRAVYRAQDAEAGAVRNRRRPKPTELAGLVRLREIVEAKLASSWSPDQAAAPTSPAPDQRGQT